MSPNPSRQPVPHRLALTLAPSALFLLPLNILGFWFPPSLTALIVGLLLGLGLATVYVFARQRELTQAREPGPLIHGPGPLARLRRRGSRALLAAARRVDHGATITEVSVPLYAHLKGAPHQVGTVRVPLALTVPAEQPAAEHTKAAR